MRFSETNHQVTISIIITENCLCAYYHVCTKGGGGCGANTPPQSAHDLLCFLIGYGSLSPTYDEWSPDIISDAVRTPQPIRLISHDEPPSLITASNTGIEVKLVQ